MTAVSPDTACGCQSTAGSPGTSHLHGTILAGLEKVLQSDCSSHHHKSPCKFSLLLRVSNRQSVQHFLYMAGNTVACFGKYRCCECVRLWLLLVTLASLKHLGETCILIWKSLYLLTWNTASLLMIVSWNLESWRGSGWWSALLMFGCTVNPIISPFIEAAEESMD